MPLAAYGTREVRSESAALLTENAINTLIDTADAVHLAGEGTRRYVWISLPGGIDTTDVGGRHVSINVSITGQITEFHGLSLANLTGSVPARRGTFKMLIEAQSSTVLINAS